MQFILPFTNTKGDGKNMIEQIFKLTQGNEKTVEKVIIDENIHYMHMVYFQGKIWRLSSTLQ